MKKWKLTIEVPEDPQRGTVIVEAETKEEAFEIADEMFQENYDAFTWDAPDVSRMDYIELIDAQVMAGPCPCGGYFEDWSSHASECIEINDEGRQF